MEKKAGLTLIEVLISAAIFVLIGAAILGILNIADRIWYEDMAAVELQQSVRHTIDTMLREIRQSKPADIVLDALSNGAKITFKVPDNNNQISYYLENVNGILYTVREHPVGTKRFLTANINSLCFCWNSTTSSCSTACSDVLTVRIAGSKTVKQRTLQFNLVEKGRLRNE